MFLADLGGFLAGGQAEVFVERGFDAGGIGLRADPDAGEDAPRHVGVEGVEVGDVAGAFAGDGAGIGGEPAAGEGHGLLAGEGAAGGVGFAHLVAHEGEGLGGERGVLLYPASCDAEINGVALDGGEIPRAVEQLGGGEIEAAEGRAGIGEAGRERGLAGAEGFVDAELIDEGAAVDGELLVGAAVGAGDEVDGEGAGDDVAVVGGAPADGLRHGEEARAVDAADAGAAEVVEGADAVDLVDHFDLVENDEAVAVLAEGALGVGAGDANDHVAQADDAGGDVVVVGILAGEVAAEGRDKALAVDVGGGLGGVEGEVDGPGRVVRHEADDAERGLGEAAAGALDDVIFAPRGIGEGLGELADPRGAGGVVGAAATGAGAVEGDVLIRPAPDGDRGDEGAEGGDEALGDEPGAEAEAGKGAGRGDGDRVASGRGCGRGELRRGGRARGREVEEEGLIEGHGRRASRRDGGRLERRDALSADPRLAQMAKPVIDKLSGAGAIDAEAVGEVGDEGAGEVFEERGELVADGAAGEQVAVFDLGLGEGLLELVEALKAFVDAAGAEGERGFVGRGRADGGLVIALEDVEHALLAEDRRGQIKRLDRFEVGDRGASLGDGRAGGERRGGKGVGAGDGKGGDGRTAGDGIGPGREERGGHGVDLHALPPVDHRLGIVERREIRRRARRAIGAPAFDHADFPLVGCLVGTAIGERMQVAGTRALHGRRFGAQSQRRRGAAFGWRDIVHFHPWPCQKCKRDLGGRA